MSILSVFVIIPALMLLGLWLAKNLNQVRGVMVAGSSCLLALSIWLTIYFIQERAAGNTAEMLLTYSTPLVHPAFYRCVRLLHLYRPVHHVHVLRGGSYPDVPSDWCMG